MHSVDVTVLSPFNFLILFNFLVVNYSKKPEIRICIQIALFFDFCPLYSTRDLEFQKFHKQIRKEWHQKPP